MLLDLEWSWMSPGELEVDVELMKGDPFKGSSSAICNPGTKPGNGLPHNFDSKKACNL
jgi:hypothetical protein